MLKIRYTAIIGETDLVQIFKKIKIVCRKGWKFTWILFFAHRWLLRIKRKLGTSEKKTLIIYSICFIQFKWTEISNIGTLLIVRFIQDSVLIRGRGLDCTYFCKNINLSFEKPNNNYKTKFVRIKCSVYIYPIYFDKWHSWHTRSTPLGKHVFLPMWLSWLLPVHDWGMLHKMSAMNKFQDKV